MVPSDVLSRVRDGLVETTAKFWSDAELYRYMTDGEREINLITNANIISTAATTVTSQSGYTLPSDCLAVTRVAYDGVPLRKLDQNMRDRDGLDMPGYGGALTTSNPTHWFELSGTGYLWPTPAAAKTLQWYYLAEPASITTSSSAFTVRANYHTPIVDYVLYRAYVKDQDQSRADWYKREYEEGVAKAHEREQRRKWAGGFPTVKTPETHYGADGGLV